MKKNIIFSPHCDDVALSLGGAINCNLLSGDIKVYDVFTVSNYTILEQGTGNPEKITKLRNDEEKKVLALLGVKYELWGYPEPLLREGYRKMSDIFNPDTNPRNDKLFKELTQKVSMVYENNKHASFYFPLGLGSHIDHIILSTIGLELLCDNPELRLYFYEDQPYVGRDSLEKVARTVQDKAPGFVSHTFRFDDILGKMAILKHYKSQFDAEDIAWTYHHTQRRGGEVVWANEKNIAYLEEQNESS